MKSLQTMKNKELFDNFMIIINTKYMPEIIRSPEANMEFYRTYPRESGNGEQSAFLKRFFERYSRFLDKEAYVFFTLKTIKEELPGGLYGDIEKKCIEALKGSNYTFFEVNRHARKVGDEIRRVTASELTGEYRPRTMSENEKRVAQIKEAMDLSALFTIHSVNELKEICTDPELPTLITKIGMIEALNEVRPISMKERMEILRSNNSDILDQLIAESTPLMEGDSMKKFYSRIPEFLEKYPDQFDIDKILLISACRATMHLEQTKLTPEEKKYFTEKIMIIKDLIKDRKVRVSGLVHNDGNGNYEYNFSYQALVRTCNRIDENGDYFSTTEELTLADDIEADLSVVAKTDPAKLKMMNFKDSDWAEICEVEGNLEHLVRNGVLPRERIQRILRSDRLPERDVTNLVKDSLLDPSSIRIYLASNRIIGKDLYTALNEIGMFSADDKWEYYMAGRIELDQLEQMTDEEKAIISGKFSPAELIKLFRDPSRESEYLRYSAAYRSIVMRDLDKDARTELGNQIIEATECEIDDEDFIKLYEQHLIPLSVLESWSGSDLVVRLMKEAKLKPIDVKEICITNGNYESVLQIMRDSTISRANKLAVFYTTFSDEDEQLTPEQKMEKEKAKMLALRELGLKDTKYVTSGKGGTRVGPSEPTKESNQYVLEPMNRWNLIRLLDEDYSYEMLDTGMMIFKLPNVKNGVVILEKMFKRDQSDYGRATKFVTMPIGDFEKIKPDLIRNGDIPPSVVDEHPGLASKFESVWHTTAWARRIAELCGYKSDPRRSKENIEAIDKEIERTEKSRRLR